MDDTGANFEVPGLIGVPEHDKALNGFLSRVPEPLLPRPSTLPNLEICSQFQPRPRSAEGAEDALDDAADEGTLVHAKMESLAGVPVESWGAAIDGDPDLGVALADTVRGCADQVRDVFTIGLPVVTKAKLGLAMDDHYHLGGVTRSAVCGGDPADAMTFYPLRNDLHVFDGVYCEVGVRPRVCRPGTADVVVICGALAELIDYKTVRVVRDHDAQMKAYVVGIFLAVPRIRQVRVRIVAPRLGDGAHEAVVYSRDRDLPGLVSELSRLVEKSADRFAPGHPGAACCFCAGNGRCAWQAASLRDIPAQAEALVRPEAWSELLSAATPELRGERRALVKWLEGFVNAAKEDDKAWALANPEALMPGFKRVSSPGRLSLDRTRYFELNTDICTGFGITAPEMLGFCRPDREAVVKHAAFIGRMTEAEAELQVKKLEGKYSKRGADIVSFRAEKPTKSAAPAAAKKQLPPEPEG